MNDRDAFDAVRHAAMWFTPSEDGLAPLLDLIGDARLVLIGEASHGTEEFYRIRANLTSALIRRKQFNVVDFLEWLWRFNAKRMATDRVGLYGLDLYSLHASMDAVLTYLTNVYPEAASRARRRYACFEQFGTDEAQSYGYAATLGVSPSCEDDVVAQLMEMQKLAADSAVRGADEETFFAFENARLVRNAERYYRAMLGGQVASWNLRDTHMMETLEALLAATTDRSGYARAVVWAHNSHLGDARATQMGDWGELNLGQLARERHGNKVFLVGFTTHTGTVTAAREWDAPVERRPVTPSLKGSYERLFHDTGFERFVLRTADAREALDGSRLERASHYFRARIADQFDAVIHVDTTSALTPLERRPREHSDLPETYPTGV